VSAAAASLAALLLAILLSCTSRINVGVLCIGFAWLIGTGLAGWTGEQVLGGFPLSLFVTLTGVTLLFALAEGNDTLQWLAAWLVGLAGGGSRLVPIILFLLAGLLSSIGPGAVSATALLAPLAMVIGAGAGASPVLTALMVANGANAGNLSPVSAVGVIANTKMAEAGLGPHPGKVWFANFAAHVVVGAVAYAIFSRRGTRRPTEPAPVAPSARPALTGGQWLTLGVIVVWVAGVVMWRVNVGLSAFAAAALLAACRVADETAAFRRVPWSIIIMVCGVSVLIGVLEKSGGMVLFSGLLSRLATPRSVTGVIAFVTGLISSWSSTSGVVLPAFLPAVPGLVARVGGGDPLAVALSVNVGASLVDVSPLSTIGALCVAAITDPAEARGAFRTLLLWGLSMTLVGAGLCQLFAGVLATL
jgi:di/tricarboxylate transporter